MPDISTPETPKIAPIDVLQYGSETRTIPTTRPETLERQKRLRALKEKGATGKERITAARESGAGSFSTNQAVAMELAFGAGKAHEVVSATGKQTTEPDSTKNPDNAEKNSHETAKQLIEGVSNYIQYADITAEAGRRNKSIDVVIRERVARGDTSISNTRDFINAREDGLNLILQSSTVQELFPELSSLNDGARRRYIEETLAKDPVMRNEVVKLMKNIAVDAQKLPDVTTDEDYSKAKADKAIAEPKLDTAKTNILNVIRADISATPPLTPAQEDQIKSWIDQGMAPETIMKSLGGLVINGTNIPKFTELQAIVEKQREISQTKERLNKTSKPAERGGLQNDINNLLGDINVLKGTVVSDTDINNFVDLLTKYSPAKDAAGIYVSGIAQSISEASALGKEIKASDDIIKRKESDSLKSEKASKNARLAAEQDLIERLENVMADAAASTLEKRYDELEGLEKKALTEDKEKQNNSDDEAIKKAMETRWIRYDPNTRSKDSDTAQINTDVRMLAYEGEDGVKRLLVRELGFTLIDEDGNPIPDPVDYRTVDLTKLSEDQKKRLEEAYSKHGETLRNKLFKDMFLARTLGSRLKDRIPGTHKIGLKKHEWELLEQNFSGKLSDAISKSKEAQGIIKNLEAQGIRPDFKMKWLIWLAAILGVGAVAGIGIAPIAVAAGAGAKAAGGAAWSGAL